MRRSRNLMDTAVLTNFTKSAFCALGAVLLNAGLTHAAPLQPHRAVYDIALERADEEAGISAASGRMVYELRGSVCDGFTVNYRFVSELTPNEGTVVISDFQVTTYEEGDGSVFNFSSKNTINNGQADEVRGVAIRGEKEIDILLTRPDEINLQFPARAVFPSQQFLDVLAAAESNKRIMQHLVYDASDEGQTIYESTSVIGKRQNVSKAENNRILKMNALSETPFWPVTISYFELETSGEILPDYVTSFLVHSNGISRSITMDYGNMVLAATLTDLELFEVPLCN